MLRALLLSALLSVPAVAGAVDLAGTWHVLVHYRDDATAHPDWLRWEDRLWIFERAGDRWVWTEHPIVVFDDQGGRFERSGGNRASRVIGGWTPNEAQLSEIQSGLEYNTRGTKRKTLSGSDAGGWRSPAPRGSASASVITYVEIWSIDDLATLPVFVRSDILGGARAESMEGRTEYRTTAVEQAGALLRGTWERDGTRHGEFWMTRAGTPSIVRGSGRTQGERVMEHFFGQFADALTSEEAFEAELERMRRSGKVDAEARREVERRFRETLEQEMRARNAPARHFRPQLDSLARRMAVLYLDEGKSVDEIRAMLADGRLRP